MSKASDQAKQATRLALTILKELNGCERFERIHALTTALCTELSILADEDKEECVKHVHAIANTLLESVRAGLTRQ